MNALMRMVSSLVGIYHPWCVMIVWALAWFATIRCVVAVMLSRGGFSVRFRTIRNNLSLL